MASYVAVEELAAWLRIKDASADPELSVSLEGAVDAVAAFCGRTFDDAAGSATARVFKARHCDLITIDPVASTTDLVIKTDTSNDGTYNQTWDAADYQLEPLNQRQAGLADHPYYKIRAVKSKTFPVSGRATVEVTARWGWTTVPAPVKTATLMHAARLHSRRNTAAGIATGESLPTRMAMGLGKDEQHLLMPFQRQDLWQ